MPSTRCVRLWLAATGAVTVISALTGCGNAGAPATAVATPKAPLTRATSSVKALELTPAQAVGVIETRYDNLNVHATEANVHRALQPVPVSKYTAREAAVEFGRKLNVFYLSGTYDDNAIDDSGNRGDETPASKKQGNEMLAAIFGSDEISGQNSSNYDQLRFSRTDLALLTGYFDNQPLSPSATPGKGGRFYDAETRKYEFATVNTTYNVVSVVKNSAGYDVTIEDVYSTNLRGIDKGSADGNILSKSGTLNSVKGPVTMELVDQNDEWHVGFLNP